MTHFLYLGNLIPDKGVLVLLETCRLLANEEKSFRCHIVGAGSKEINVEDMMIQFKQLLNGDILKELKIQDKLNFHQLQENYV